jgi:proton-coupled amino acid transporter
MHTTTVALASAIPRLDLFISLVGACSSSTLALIAPPIIDTITFWPEVGKHRWRLVKNCFIFVLGLVGFLTGTFISVRNIVSYFVTGE